MREEVETSHGGKAKPERLTRPQAGGGVRSTEPLRITTQQMINPERVTEHIVKFCHPFRVKFVWQLLAGVPLRSTACLWSYHPFGVQRLQTPNSKLKTGVPLRSTACLWSYHPFGVQRLQTPHSKLQTENRGSAALHHLPVVLPPLRGSATPNSKLQTPN